MKFEPHEYQKKAIQFLSERPEAGLFLNCGLGKTVIALTNIVNNWLPARVLIIAPLRVAQTVWAEECLKWDHLKHLKVVKILGSHQHRTNVLSQRGDIFVINRENVPWLVDIYRERWNFTHVIIDESSSFKSAKTARFKALRKVRHLIKKIVILSATPVPNGYIDLWSQMYLLDIGKRLGRTMKNYQDLYFNPGSRIGHIVTKWELKEGKDKDIISAISDVCMHMDNSNLPELTEITRTVAINDAKYKSFQKEKALAVADTHITAVNAAVLTSKLLQYCNGAIYDEFRNVHLIHDEKLEELESIIEENNGQPLLVFYMFKHDVTRICARFPQARMLKTAEDINDWNAGKVQLLVAHPCSAGHGINLQYGGNTLVWFGLPWSHELYTQGIGRLHRQGQQNGVRVFYILADKTIDGRVLEMLKKKGDIQNMLLEALKC